MSGRPRLSRQRIAEAAFELIEREGLDAVTMRRLAEELGVEAASLYEHITGKDELLRLVAEELSQRLVIPQVAGGAPWREQIRTVITAFAQIARAHPRVFPLLFRPRPFVRSDLLPGEAILGALFEAGFEPANALTAYYTITNFVDGVLLRQTRGPDPRESRTEQPGSWFDADQVPNWVRATAAAADVTDETIFAYGVELLLQGLERAPRNSG